MKMRFHLKAAGEGGGWTMHALTTRGNPSQKSHFEVLCRKQWNFGQKVTLRLECTARQPERLGATNCAPDPKGLFGALLLQLRALSCTSMWGVGLGGGWHVGTFHCSVARFIKAVPTAPSPGSGSWEVLR